MIGLLKPIQLKNFLSIIVLTVISLICLSSSRSDLRSFISSYKKLESSQPPLYLPEAKYIKLITLGFDNFASDILWFNTINYFGKQLETSKDIPWFGQMCNLVSILDPKARQVVEFCSTLLSWIGKDPEQSKILLERAITFDPDYWRYHYLLGFTEWYFLYNKEKAGESLATAARLPDAPIFLSSLASKLLATTSSPNTAINFLKELIEKTTDKNAKKALEEKLMQAYISRDIQFLESRVSLYKEKYHSYPKTFEGLIEKKLLKKFPRDPNGAFYILNPSSGEVFTQDGKKGLEFTGKTAKSGLAKSDWEN